jgi:hypothetical protein
MNSPQFLTLHSPQALTASATGLRERNRDAGRCQPATLHDAAVRLHRRQRRTDCCMARHGGAQQLDFAALPEQRSLQVSAWWRWTWIPR